MKNILAIMVVASVFSTGCADINANYGLQAQTTNCHYKNDARSCAVLSVMDVQFKRRTKEQAIEDFWKVCKASREVCETEVRLIANM